MSNVIQFLESLGSRPAPSPAEYAATVASAVTTKRKSRASLR